MVKISKKLRFFVYSGPFIGVLLPCLFGSVPFAWVDAASIIIILYLLIYYVTVEVLEKLKSKRSTKEP